MKKALTLAFFVYVASFLAYGFQPEAYVGFTVRADSAVVKKQAKLSRKIKKARRKLGLDTDSLKSGLAASGNSGKDSLGLAMKNTAKKADSLLRNNIAQLQADTLKGSIKQGADSLRKQGAATISLFARNSRTSLLGKNDSSFKAPSSLPENLNKDSLAHKLKEEPNKQIAGKLSSLAVQKESVSNILQKADSLNLGDAAKERMGLTDKKDALFSRIRNGFDTKLKSPVLGKFKSRKDSVLSGKDKLDSTKTRAVAFLKKKKHIPFGLGLGYESMYFRESPISTGSLYTDVFSVSTKFQMGKIPVSFGFAKSYNSETGFQTSQSSLFKFDFDPFSFNQNLRSDLDKLSDFRKAELGGLTLPDYTRKSISSKMRNIPGNESFSKNASLNNYLKKPENVTELLSLDEVQLREKLAKLMKAPAGPAVKDSLKAGLPKTEANQKLKQNIDSIVASIASIKEGLVKNGLNPQDISTYQKVLSGNKNIDEIGEEELASLSKKPGMNKAQSLFSRVHGLKVGSFGSKVPGQQLNRDMFMQGFDLSISTRNGPARIGFGAQNDAGMPKDHGLEGSSYLSSRYLSYLSVATHKNAFGTGKVSWVGLFNKQQGDAAFNANTLSRSSMAVTISQSVNMQKLGSLTVDLSKSGGQYRNTLSGVNDQLYMERGLLINYFTDELLENFSVGFTHHVDANRIGLASNVYFNYAGIGYQNPGMPGNNSLKMRLGGSMKKQLFNNKMSLGFKADLKNTPLSTSATGAYWKNYQYQADSRFKINRNYSLALKYSDNGMDRMDTVAIPMYSSRKLQASGNANYKIGKLHSFSYITIGYQTLRNNAVMASNSSLLTMNYTQTVPIKQYTLNGSVFYNKEMSAFKLLGDMLNTDLGCQYPLFRKFNLSTSATYLENKGAARQAGIRQSVQYSPVEGLDMSVYADLRKNLITPLYPGLYTAGRGEISLKYYLKN